MLQKFFDAGADVFRLNFSHGSYQSHAKTFADIRALETKMGRPIVVLQDLQGPKLRIGTFKKGPIKLTAGDALRLDLDPEPGTAKRVLLDHPEIFAALRQDMVLLLDDGNIQTQGA